ncbi:unnamed protein product [Schistosoma margrebowiei]|uniref:Uncharacterized protein n=1 Tax=Schistosoma margrebowiei TaxID=48269 RepID=A0A183N0R8_9TREM|nr:unnamed protein product [Schistosoma margrebowiei]
MLKTLMVNSDDNRNCNHMDAMKTLHVDMNILNPLKYLINPNLSETPDQMNDINIFIDRVASEIFKDIKTLPNKTPCQRKAGRDSYRPPASNSQTHHNPNGRKVKSDSKRTSSFTSMPPPKKSSESPKVQNPEEVNPDVGGVHSLKNVDLDSTRSSYADDEWDNTVQTTVSATHSYSNCATDNRKTNHNIHITVHALNVDIFELRKPSQVCLTVHIPLQHMKKPKSTTDLKNKCLKHVTHTSGINSYLNCN